MCELQQPVPAANGHRYSDGGQDGVFATVDEAVNAAYEAQKKVAEMDLEQRGRMIETSFVAYATTAARRTRPEWRWKKQRSAGGSDHKILKLQNMRYVLGVEAMRSDARQFPDRIVHHRARPLGRVIGMMLPVTHSVPTMVSNAINILAAGNTAVFGPHRFPAPGSRNMRCRFSTAKSSGKLGVE